MENNLNLLWKGIFFFERGCLNKLENINLMANLCNHWNDNYENSVATAKNVYSIIKKAVTKTVVVLWLKIRLWTKDWKGIQKMKIELWGLVNYLHSSGTALLCITKKKTPFGYTVSLTWYCSLATETPCWACRVMSSQPLAILSQDPGPSTGQPARHCASRGKPKMPPRPPWKTPHLSGLMPELNMPRSLPHLPCYPLNKLHHHSTYNSPWQRCQLYAFCSSMGDFLRAVILSSSPLEAQH